MGLSSVTQLSMHFRHSCAIADGGLSCWGENRDGELGRGVRSISPSPVAIPLTGAVDRVAVGFNFACAVVAGAVWCWGSNSFGQGGVATSARSPDVGCHRLSVVEGIDGEVP
jgi:alpha-tubulin suppressor-like RCC1 family protein